MSEPEPPRDRRSATGWLKARGRQLARLPGQLRTLAADDRVPLRAKLLLLGLALYLLNPVDLIPDFVPIIGHFDDIVIAAALLALAARWTPEEVWQDHFRGER